jgi:hypothetical protein
LVFALGSIFIWILLVVVFVRYQRQNKKFKLHSDMVVTAVTGDVEFSTPEAMRKELAGGEFSGGEVDPVTGQITMYKTGGADMGDPNVAMSPLDARMPAVWSGQRSNPMTFGMSDLNDESGGGDDGGEGDDDSLGNLSDFEDADFEAFADSLLDDNNLDEELFGYQRDPNVVPAFRNPPPVSPEDSLSDFENDDDLLGDLGDLSPVVVTGTGRVTSMFARSAGVPVNVARSASHEAAATLPRPSSTMSIDDMDLDAAVVVASTKYEDVGQSWRTQNRPGSSIDLAENTDDVITAF